MSRVYRAGTIMFGSVLVSILILASTSAKAATMDVHLPVIGDSSWAVLISAVLMFGNSFLLGALLRNWWVLVFSPGLTGFWSLLIILSDPGRSTQRLQIELALVELFIPSLIGVITGVVLGQRAITRYHHI